MTIYQALQAKLGREPTNAELKAEIREIMEETLVEMATAGKLPWQHKRQSRRR